MEWSEAWKLATIAAPIAIGAFKSWRNRWKGPRGFIEFLDRRIHPETENAKLRYENFRLRKENTFLTKQLAYRDTQMDQVMLLAEDQSKTASLLESSVASVAEEIKIQIASPTTTSSLPRLRKPKPDLFTPSG